MRKLAFCIWENKDADHLRGNCEADQCLCIRYIDSTIPLHPIYEISSLKPSRVDIQPGLCQTWFVSDLVWKPRFSHNEAHTGFSLRAGCRPN